MMTFRDRFLKIMYFEKPDRGFLWGDWGWQETLKRWHKEGLPEDMSLEDFFGFDRFDSVPINIGFGNPLIPQFEAKILEDDGVHQIVRDPDGSKRKIFKDKRETSMDQWLEYPVKNRADWDEYKKRLNPYSPTRYPPNWEELKKVWKDRDYPLGIINAGGFYMWPRLWMGVERLSCAFYDDPQLVHDMVNYCTEFMVETIKKAVREIEPKIDCVVFSEDMAYKGAPLLSPKHFRRFILPAYKKVTTFLRSSGIETIIVDSDGNINELVPLLLEGGVNGLWPLEVAAGVNAVQLRKKYKNLLLIGNIDKRPLAKGKREIEQEVFSKVPWLLSQGGYIPCVDHGVPPDVPWKNFRYYRLLIRKLVMGD